MRKSVLTAFGLEDSNYIKESKFIDLIKSEEFDIFGVVQLNQYRVDLFKAIQELPEKDQAEALRQSEDEFKLLTKKTILKADGGQFDAFIKPKKKDGEDEEDETNKEAGKEDDVEAGKEGDEAGKEENEANAENNEEGALSEEEQSLFDTILEGLKDGGQVSEAEIEEGSQYTEEVTALIQSLVDKGYILVDDSLNVTGLGPNAPESTDDTSSEQNNDDIDAQAQAGGDADIANQQEDINNNDSSDNGSSAEQEVGKNADAGQSGAAGQMDENQLKAHAKDTDSQALQAFIDNPSADPKHKAIAKAELESRGEGAQNNDQNNQQGGEIVDEEKEIKDWIGKHLDNHDEEDLRDYTKKLILQDTGKLKELKQHYRTDFSQKNGGNSVTGKIDQKDFDEWLEQYLSHLPFNDLKDYASKLIGKNPKAFNQLKSQFSELKENNMLD